MAILVLVQTQQAGGRSPEPAGNGRDRKLIEESFKSGVLLATEGCQPSAKGARVRLSGGKFTLIDGPFTESKELVAGFALIQADSKQQAIEYTKRFLEVAGDGETEIRQVFEASDFPAETFSPEISAREKAWSEEQQKRAAKP